MPGDEKANESKANCMATFAEITSERTRVEEKAKRHLAGSSIPERATSRAMSPLLGSSSSASLSVQVSSDSSDQRGCARRGLPSPSCNLS